MPVPPSLTIDEALLRLRTKLAHGRVVLGIAGPPAVGKSTVAQRVLEWATSGGWRAVVIAMDGFHLAQSVLDERGLAAVKGAPQTFDAGGYAELLRRVHAQPEGAGTIWAPHFDRSIENAIAGSIGVTPADRLIITEGNYLLLSDDPWPSARSYIDECWYLELTDDIRRARLFNRHRSFGHSVQEADERTNGSDEANAILVTSRRCVADLLVHVD